MPSSTLTKGQKISRRFQEAMFVPVQKCSYAVRSCMRSGSAACRTYPYDYRPSSLILDLWKRSFQVLGNCQDMACLSPRLRHLGPNLPQMVGSWSTPKLWELCLAVGRPQNLETWLGFAVSWSARQK